VLCLSYADVELLKKIAQCSSLRHLVQQPPSLFFVSLSFFLSFSFFSHHKVGRSRHAQVLDPFAVGQTGMGEGQGLFPHTAINEYSEQKLLQMHWQLLGH
jgi:hypothetical protein